MKVDSTQRGRESTSVRCSPKTKGPSGVPTGVEEKGK